MSHEGFSQRDHLVNLRLAGTGSGMARCGHMPFLLLLLDVFWNFMKFDMSHERVLSKGPFSHSEGTRNRFRNDQIEPYIESVFLEDADLYSMRFDAKNFDILDGNI